MKRTILLGMGLLAWSHFLPAQVLGPAPEGEGKVWNIRFVIDPGLTTWYARYRDAYQGERYINATDSSAAHWEWAEWDSVDNRVLDYYKAGNVRLGVLLNVYDRFYLGVNYCFYLVQGYPRGTSPNNLGSYVYWPFMSLSGSLNYDYVLPFLGERFSLQPTLSVGTYQSERSFEGIGQEWAYEGRLGLAFRLREGGQSQVRVWANYQHLTYRSSETSFVYPERQRRIESDWDMTSVGVGLVWHLSIQEDYQELPSRRKLRRKRRLERKQERLEEKMEGGGS